MLNLLSPYTRRTDEALMRRVATEADERAYDTLYERHARRLMGFLCRQFCGDEALAADLMQDTFLRVWASRQRFAPEAEFRPWLYTIACNLCKNEFRRRAQTGLFRQETAATAAPAGDSGAERQLDAEAFRKALAREVEHLPPAQRMLYALRFEEELPVAQIATILALPEGTVKSRQHTLVQTLKQRLKPYE